MLLAEEKYFHLQELKYLITYYQHAQISLYQLQN